MVRSRRPRPLLHFSWLQSCFKFFVLCFAVLRRDSLVLCGTLLPDWCNLLPHSSLSVFLRVDVDPRAGAALGLDFGGDLFVFCFSVRISATTCRTLIPSEDLVSFVRLWDLRPLLRLSRLQSCSELFDLHPPVLRRGRLVLCGTLLLVRCSPLLCSSLQVLLRVEVDRLVGALLSFDFGGDPLFSCFSVPAFGLGFGGDCRFFPVAASVCLCCRSWLCLL